MSLLGVPVLGKMDPVAWFNPAYVTSATLSGTTLTLYMVDDPEDVPRLEVKFDTVEQARAFVRAISLHGTPSGVS